MTYDNIKNNKKKQGFTLSLEDASLEKPQGEAGGGGRGRIDLSLLRLLRVKEGNILVLYKYLC